MIEKGIHQRLEIQVIKGVSIPDRGRLSERKKQENKKKKRPEVGRKRKAMIQPLLQVENRTIVDQKEIQALQQRGGKTYSIKRSLRGTGTSDAKALHITKKKMNTLPSPLHSSP